MGIIRWGYCAAGSSFLEIKDMVAENSNIIVKFCWHKTFYIFSKWQLLITGLILWCWLIEGPLWCKSRNMQNSPFQQKCPNF